MTDSNRERRVRRMAQRRGLKLMKSRAARYASGPFFIVQAATISWSCRGTTTTG